MTNLTALVLLLGLGAAVDLEKLLDFDAPDLDLHNVTVDEEAAFRTMHAHKLKIQNNFINEGEFSIMANDLFELFPEDGGSVECTFTEIESFDNRGSFMLIYPETAVRALIISETFKNSGLFEIVAPGDPENEDESDSEDEDDEDDHKNGLKKRHWPWRKKKSDLLIKSDSSPTNGGLIVISGGKGQPFVVDFSLSDNTPLINLGSLCLINAIWHQDVPVEGEGYIIVAQGGELTIDSNYVFEREQKIILIPGKTTAKLNFILGKNHNTTRLLIIGMRPGAILSFHPPLGSYKFWNHGINGEDLELFTKDGQLAYLLDIGHRFEPERFKFDGETLQYDGQRNVVLPPRVSCNDRILE